MSKITTMYTGKNQKMFAKVTIIPSVFCFLNDTKFSIVQHKETMPQIKKCLFFMLFWGSFQ